VVTVDGDVPNSKRIAFVGTGKLQRRVTRAASTLAKAIDGKGKVALDDQAGQGNLEERDSPATRPRWPTIGHGSCRSRTPSPTHVRGAGRRARCSRSTGPGGHRAVR
jgi:hypothetical protein